jgi:hypothetical protein
VADAYSDLQQHGLAAAFVQAMQDADHPAWGQDWSEWLQGDEVAALYLRICNTPVECSYLPIDTGFDLRIHPEMSIELPAGSMLKVRYMDDEDERAFEGDRAAVIEKLTRAGYRVQS